jgi:hypothetical protein
MLFAPEPFQIKYFPAVQNDVILIHRGSYSGTSYSGFTVEEGCTFFRGEIAQK